MKHEPSCQDQTSEVSTKQAETELFELTTLELETLLLMAYNRGSLKSSNRVCDGPLMFIERTLNNLRKEKNLGTN